MTPPGSPEAHQHQAFVHTWQPPPGRTGALLAVNNRVIGMRYMVTSLVFFVLGGVMALVMRTQLAVGEQQLVGPELYNGLFTMHGSTMMYLFVIPFLEGLAVYLVPLMIGSRDLAFPRLSAFGYWVYLFGGLVFYASFVVGALPDAGWFAYTPLSGPRFSGKGQDLWLVGLALVEVGGIAAGVELLVTILKLRAPGMSLQRMPVFVWTWLVTSFMIVFAFTTLLVTTLLLELDRTAGTRFFDPDHGGSSLLWQHLFWFFGHPEVYISFLPATGIVSQMVPVIARRRLVAYELVVAAVLLTGFLSFGLWVHHMFTTGLPELSKSFFTGASLLIAVASGIQIFAWIATLWGTRPALDARLLYLLGFLFIFVLGGMTGVMVAVVPFDAQVHDTYFVVAHFHYVLVGGVVFPIMAALHHWGPALTGRTLHEGVGRVSFALTFVGFNVAFFPMHVMGFLGLPRRVYTYPRDLGLDAHNLTSTVASYALGLGFLLVLGNLLWSARRGPPAGRDPWGGDGLEWSGALPPPYHGADTPPRVTGRHALWADDHPLDERSERAREALASAPHNWRGVLVTDALDARPQAIQHLPGPSFIPLVTAVAMLVAGIAVLVGAYLLAGLALLGTAYAVRRWLTPEPVALGLVARSGLDEAAGVELFPTGARSVAWWGAVWLLVTIGVGFAVLLAAWSYLWLHAPAWPPPATPTPPMRAPLLPGLLLVAAAVPALRAYAPIAEGSRRVARRRLGLALLLGTVSLLLHASLLAAVPFSWTTHAYASAFWALHGALILIQGTFALLMVTVWWFLRRPRDPLQPLQVQIVGLCWAFQAVMALVVHAAVHAAPWLVGA